jgi:hypothetical protein
MCAYREYKKTGTALAVPVENRAARLTLNVALYPCSVWLSRNASVKVAVSYSPEPDASPPTPIHLLAIARPNTSSELTGGGRKFLAGPADTARPTGQGDDSQNGDQLIRSIDLTFQRAFTLTD